MVLNNTFSWNSEHKKPCTYQACTLKVRDFAYDNKYRAVYGHLTGGSCFVIQTYLGREVLNLKLIGKLNEA